MLRGEMLGRGSTGTSTVNNPDPFGDSSGVSLYQLDGDVTDTASSHHGTATNITYTTGEFGQCAIANGVDSNIDLATSSSLMPSADFTISMWINMNDKTTQQYLATKYTTTITRGSIVQFSSDVMSFYTFSASATLEGFSAFSMSALSIATWYNMIIEVEKGVGARFYIDGVLQTNTNSDTHAIMYDNGDDVRLLDAIHQSTPYDGKADQIRFFNRVLTSGERTILQTEEIV